MSGLPVLPTDYKSPFMSRYYSIGHGTRSLEAFLEVLQTFHIKVLADIRSYPGSRRSPHFNRESLAPILDRLGILYVWLPALGGFRKTGLGSRSPHSALTSPGFRNYADYMDTEAFQKVVQELLALSEKGPVCFMCAETPPQRCHRRLLSDYLLAQGIQVIHILDKTRTLPHRLSRMARIGDGRVIYDQLPS